MIDDVTDLTKGTQDALFLFRSDYRTNMRKIAKNGQGAAAKVEDINMQFVRRMSQRQRRDNRAQESGLPAARSAKDHGVPIRKIDLERLLAGLIGVVDDPYQWTHGRFPPGCALPAEI